MNNIVMSLKRFLKNKNTVTLIGVIAIVFILKFGYDQTISSQVSPITVPVAAETIQPRTLITDDMITTIQVPSMLMKENVIRYKANIVGMYSNYNTLIPEGSMFYDELLIEEEYLPNYSFKKVADGEEVYAFPVTMQTTYGNSIFPGDYVDLYMKAENEDGQIMVGKFIENVEVLDVKDSQGRHVFENTDEARTPSTFIFGVEPELLTLLLKAGYMTAYSVEIFPVPHGGSVTETGLEVGVTSENLKEFINVHTVPNDDINPDLIDEDELIEENENAEQ